MDPTATQCQFCWRVRDDGSDRRSSTAWADLPAFIQKYDLKPHDLSFSEGYCPDCDRFYCQLTQSVWS
jgi:hypothetical protein